MLCLAFDDEKQGMLEREGGARVACIVLLVLLFIVCFG